MSPTSSRTSEAPASGPADQPRAELPRPVSGSAVIVAAAALCLLLVVFILVFSGGLRQQLLDQLGFTDLSDRDVIASERLASGEVLTVAMETDARGASCVVVEFDEQDAGRACSAGASPAGTRDLVHELTAVPAPSGSVWVLAGALDVRASRVRVELAEGEDVVPSPKGSATGFGGQFFGAVIEEGGVVTAVEAEPLRGDARERVACAPLLADAGGVVAEGCRVERTGTSPDA